MNIKKFKVGMAAVLILGIAVLFLVVGVRAANSLPPGEYDLEAGQYVFNVPELIATPVPDTPVPDTPVPPTDTPIPPTDIPPTDVPSHPDGWHSPTTHEHGDPFPQWILDSPMQPRSLLGGEAHPGFKGFHFIDYVCCDSSVGTGVEAYLLVHLISTPAARLTQFHTYQIWLLDEAGNISYWQGRTNTGDPATTRTSRLEPDPGGNSRVLCVSDPNNGPQSEQWYGDAGYSAGPFLAWSIGGPNFLCNLPESLDQSTWVLAGGVGVERNSATEVTWNRFIMDRDSIFDHIYCTSSAIAGRVSCSDPDALENFVYSTFPEGTGDFKREMIRQSRIYDCPDCEVPN